MHVISGVVSRKPHSRVFAKTRDEYSAIFFERTRGEAKTPAQAYFNTFS